MFKVGDASICSLLVQYIYIYICWYVRYAYFTQKLLIAAITTPSGIVDLVRCTLDTRLSATIVTKVHSTHLPASELPFLPEGSDRHKQWLRHVVRLGHHPW